MSAGLPQTERLDDSTESRHSIEIGIFDYRRDWGDGRMSLPVFIHRDNGHFVATVVGSPDVRVSAPAREEALAGIQTILHARVLHGDLVFVETPPHGIVAFAGKYRDDPTLTQIREEH